MNIITVSSVASLSRNAGCSSSESEVSLVALVLFFIRYKVPNLWVSNVFIIKQSHLQFYWNRWEGFCLDMGKSFTKKKSVLLNIVLRHLIGLLSFIFISPFITTNGWSKENPLPFPWLSNSFKFRKSIHGLKDQHWRNELEIK